MGKDINKILDEEFLEKLRNKNLANNSNYFILFSAMPKTGKTAIAQKIEERYKGVRIKKDIAREIIYANIEITDTKQSEEILDKYLEENIGKITDLPNKLIIWDSSIDRSYENFRTWAEKYGYKIFVICLETPLDVINHRIDIELDQSTAKWYRVNLEKWETDHKNYLKIGQVDFTVTNNSEKDIKILYNKLDALLE